MTSITIQDIARELHSSPHEIAAFLDLGTDYSESQELTADDIQALREDHYERHPYRGDNYSLTDERVADLMDKPNMGAVITIDVFVDGTHIGMDSEGRAVAAWTP